MQLTYESELYHHGIKGMKWGVRRYQNKDGSLTSAGKKRLYGYSKSQAKRALKGAIKEHNPGIIPMMIDSTGKNDDAVNKAYKQEVYDKTKALRKEYRDKKFASDELPDDPEKFQSDFDSWEDRKNAAVREVAKKYVSQFNDARLKDIGYKDVELGRKMLNDYGLAFTVDELGINYKHGYR